MSLQNKIIKFIMMYRRKTYEKQNFDIIDIRRNMDDLFSKTFITPWTVSVNEIRLKGIDAEIITPNKIKRKDAIIIYVHGGGYFMGSIETHRPLAGWVVHESGVPAVIFNYRLAPEHPFPAGRDDLIKVYTELLEEYPNDRIVMVGDSAGAGLITQALLKMIDMEMELPRCNCLLSPFLDLTCTAPSYSSNASNDPFIIPEFIRQIVPEYVKPPYSIHHPEVNPLYADLFNFPDTLIHVGSIEVLLDDSKNLDARLKEYGAESTLKEYKGLPHVWHFNRQFFMPESQQALQEIGEYILSKVPQLETATHK